MTDDAILNRLKDVKYLLQDNSSLKVGDLILSSKDDTELMVSGFSTFIHLENLTKKTSLIELNEIKELFQRMLNASKELSDFVKNKKIIYFLDYDDMGKCGIGICREENGQVFWQAQLPAD